jgi:hypothetical protein
VRCDELAGREGAALLRANSLVGLAVGLTAIGELRSRLAFGGGEQEGS